MRPLLLAAALLCSTPAWAEMPPLPVPPWQSPLRQDSALVGSIHDIAGGQTLSPATLVDRLARADVVLLGETHDNPDHHALQAWVVRSLAAAGRRPAIAMEMIDPTQRAALDAFRATGASSAAGLGEAIGWSKGWPAWPIYAPIVEPALRLGTPILPANVDRDTLRGLVRGSEPIAEREAKLGLAPIEGTAARAMADDIRQGHCNMLPDAALPAMVLAQRARDRAMAQALLDGLAAPQADMAVLIAGTGHVRSDVAVPQHLRALAPQMRVMSLAFQAVPEGKVDLRALPYDFVWFTPLASDEDHCAQLRQRMQQK